MTATGSARRRQRMLVLVPHEPTLDPRIHYTAESLGRAHDVTVIATAQDEEARPEQNRPERASYETVRIRYEKTGEAEAWYAFCRLLVNGHGPRSSALAGPAAVAAFVTTVGLAIGALAAGVGFEVLVLPWMLVTHQRPSLIRPVLHALKRWLRALVAWRPGRGTDAPAVGGARPAPLHLTTSRLENVTKGLRVVGSVLRFTLAANTLLSRYVTERGLRPDLVYCHDLYSLQTGVILKRLYGATLVYDSHEYYPYQYPFWCYAPIIRRYEAALVQSVDHFITVSPALAAELSRVYRVLPIHTIPNVEPRPTTGSVRVSGDMTRLAAGRVKILFQGTFAEGRGLEEVVDAWPGVDGTKAALFLRGPRNEWLDRLEWQANELGVLGKSIFVLPPVLERDLISAAREADVGLIPYKGDWLSYRFACPNKLSQYLHAGLVILSNRLVFVEELVRAGKVGLCYDVGSADSFAETVQRLIDDRYLVDEFKKNAVAYAQNDYNWERYEGVLLGLVATKPPQPV